MVTKEEIAAVIRAVAAIAEAIRDLGRVPSGHLYAQVMGVLSLDNYTIAIDHLERAKLVRREGHELIWTGPAKEDK